MSIPRTGDWIQTYTGKQFWPLDPKVEDIDIEDIAHSLSLQCRWNGHCRQFYSVAQHAVYVASMITDPRAKLWGLHHDDTEAYLTDVPRPIKPYCGDYIKIENHLADTISLAFDIKRNTLIDKRVKEVDCTILFMERAVLLGPRPADWNNEDKDPGTSLLDFDPTFWGWTPEIAKQKYLDLHFKLIGK